MTDDWLNEENIILPKLSVRQKECLVIITQFFKKKRYYPTQKEIAQEMGTHQSAVGQIMGVLEKKGYLLRIPGEQRNIRFTKKTGMKLELNGEGGDQTKETE